MNACNKTIALGLGNNIDYEIMLTADIFQKLVTSLKISKDDICRISPITTERELVCSILFYLKTGKGGEQQIQNGGIIYSFIKNFSYKITIGGTAARAGIAMAKLGYSFFLHLVTINDITRKLLPAQAQFVCSSLEDSIYPHLIIQFPQNLTVYCNNVPVTTVLANRIIYTSDIDNADMQINKAFFKKNYDAAVMLISGFNAMQDVALLRQRLVFTAECLEKYCKNTKIYYEDACFYNRQFPLEVWNYLSKYITIYSLNEDELQTYIERSVDLLNFKDVLNALEELEQKICVPVLVVHTRHWAIAYGNEVQNYKEALNAGVIMATTRLCYGDDFSQTDYYNTAKMKREKRSEEFCSKIMKSSTKMCSVASIAVGQESVTSVGLGDAFVGGFLTKVHWGEGVNAKKRIC